MSSSPTKSTTGAPSDRGLIPREFRWALLLAALLVVGLIVAINWPYAIHRNDPLAFAERSRPLLEGQLPYFDYEFEHLPLAIVPMGITAVVEKALGNVHYTLVFWMLMSGVLFAIGSQTNRLGRRLGIDDAALRWVVISGALLPLIAFRVDALSVLLIVLTVTLAIDRRNTASGWALAGAIAAKGWPIVFAVVYWWQGKRRRALLTVALTVVGAAALAMLPGFRSGRSFSGVHIETVTGAAIALSRILFGSSARTFVAAGASYVEVGKWALAINALIGLTLAAYALRVLRTRFRWDRAVDLIGVLTIAVMLLSPLLSAQFIIWITPFAALSKNSRVRAGAAGTAYLTGVFVTFWVIDAWWWWAIIVARNAVLVGTGWYWARHMLREASPRVGERQEGQAVRP